ncbi:endospore germination permease [Paenibacillus filicis]|uniref:Endospore germination permease n=1 Tax=Paenibacillus gyeongsangnamensis TaxID=3388067 RepID=A0ABT4Q430_9BACL|nr:endospore germination permease [Paenibacillus filicis]MCZ8511607.1 endospore germination permease [Paenibacillus filicis]
MLDNGKISSRQLSLLITMCIIGTAILLLPSGIAKQAKQDAWIAAIIPILAGLLVIPLYTALGRRFPGKSFIYGIEEILGRGLGKFVSLIFLIMFPVNLSGLSLRFIGDFITTQMLPETPIESVLIIFMVIAVIGARAGIETLARSAEVFFPAFVLFFLILVLFLTPDMKVENIQPVFETGMKPLVGASLTYISYPFLEPIIFLILVDHLNRPDRMGKALFEGVFAAGLILFVITFLCIMVLGAEMTSNNLFPPYVLAKKISVGKFVERIEVLVATIWFISTYYRVTVFYYISIIGIAQVLELKDYRLLTLPVGAILVVFALVTRPNVAYSFEFLQAYTAFAPIIGILFPLLLLAVAVIRKK